MVLFFAAGDAAEAAKQASSVSGADVSAEQAPTPPPHRQSSIKFPTRRTPEGIPISSLPAEEQKTYGSPCTVRYLKF